MQGMENSRVKPESSLLGDAKLIQMNQKGFFLFNPASPLSFLAPPEDKASKMLTLSTPIH